LGQLTQERSDPPAHFQRTILAVAVVACNCILEPATKLLSFPTMRGVGLPTTTRTVAVSVKQLLMSFPTTLYAVVALG
ncbi:hypothetical protein ABTJ74_20140, partial [Acinetobacter baumannii]